MKPTDEEILEDAVADIERMIENDVVLLEVETIHLQEKIEREVLYYSLWSTIHGLITEYEREISYMNGTFVVSPLQNKDVMNAASSNGRLYTVLTTQAKLIPQFNGVPLSSTIKEHEYTMDWLLKEYLNLIRNGTSTGTTRLKASYSAGSSSVGVEDKNLTNWVLVDTGSLFRVVFSHADTIIIPGSPPSSYTVQRYSIGYKINDASYSGSRYTGDRVGSWAGYSETERSTKTATSTTQACMDGFISVLDGQLKVKQDWIQLCYDSLEKNKDPNKNQADLAQHKADLDFLIAYRLTMDISNVGLDGLELMLANRDTFVPQRIINATQEKSLYYPVRISYTNLRCDRQSGTLPYIYFMVSVLAELPDQTLIDALQTLQGGLDEL